MFKSEYAIFLGKEKDEHYYEFLIDEKIFLILEIESKTEKDQIRDLFKNTKDKISQDHPGSLKDFEAIIEDELAAKIEADAFSLVGALVVDNIFYLLTRGEGRVLIKRGDKLQEIIGEDNKASGIIKDKDLFIFTSGSFNRLIDKDGLKSVLGDLPPKELIEYIAPTLKEKDDLGAIALFIKFNHKEEEAEYVGEEKETLSEEVEPQKEVEPEQYIKSGRQINLSGFFDKVRAAQENLVQRQTSRGRKLTFLIIFIVLLVLVWSVGFGIQRRANSELKKKIEKSAELINSKLTEASDVAALNLDRSLILLSEAKDELKKLKEATGKKEIDEVKKIEEKITQKENEIVKKDEKKPQEFYDLALIEKGASGEKMSLDGDTAAILNSKDGKIYTLSLTKKSTRTIKKDEIKEADLVGIYKDDVIFLNKSKGIYKVTSDDKSKQVIKKDDDWGDLTGLSIYNGNLYFLDAKKDEIYKYSVGDNAYSDKVSYFKKGQSVDLADANSLAIDSSVYIGASGALYKYTAGLRDGFSTKFPDGDKNEFAKIFTDANNNKVYVLSKDKGKVYILNKDGEYEKQIESAIFKKANDFVALESEKKIYVLVSDKIYTVGID